MTPHAAPYRLDRRIPRFLVFVIFRAGSTLHAQKTTRKTKNRKHTKSMRKPKIGNTPQNMANIKNRKPTNNVPKSKMENTPHMCVSSVCVSAMCVGNDDDHHDDHDTS